MKSLFGFGNKNKILSQLCRDLSCSEEEVLNEVDKLRCARDRLVLDRENLRQEREDFKTYSEEYEGGLLESCTEKTVVLLADAKSKCVEIEKEAKDLEARVSHLNDLESRLNDLCKISEDKDYVVACTPDDTKAIFRRSDFERDARFLSCGLYPFLFSESFKGIERSDGSRELKDLDGDDLTFLSQGMKHPDYKIEAVKSLDQKMRCVFNSRLHFYCLSCKNGKLSVLGEDSACSADWSHVRNEDVGDKTFTYYVMTLNGVDFEFVAVPFGEDGEVDFMMSHWVTQRQWLAVLGENPAYFAGRGLDLPMENVSYDEIVYNFLPRLNNLLQEAGFEGKFKLPSDDQWERMADKNAAADFGKNPLRYSDFGKGWRSGLPLSVKSKVRGRLGAWMYGSVWECVRCLTVSDGGGFRGGSWSSNFLDVGPRTRLSYRSGNRYRDIGFRLLMIRPGARIRRG